MKNISKQALFFALAVAVSTSAVSSVTNSTKESQIKPDTPDNFIKIVPLCTPFPSCIDPK